MLPHHLLVDAVGEERLRGFAATHAWQFVRDTVLEPNHAVVVQDYDDEEHQKAGQDSHNEDYYGR